MSGIPIIGAELIVHLDGASNVLAVAGETLPPANLNTSPLVDPTTAARTALDLVAGTYAVDREHAHRDGARAMDLRPGLIGPERGPATLVWRMDVTPRDAAADS